MQKRAMPEDKVQIGMLIKHKQDCKGSQYLDVSYTIT